MRTRSTVNRLCRRSTLGDAQHGCRQTFIPIGQLVATSRAFVTGLQSSAISAIAQPITRNGIAVARLDTAITPLVQNWFSAAPEVLMAGQGSNARGRLGVNSLIGAEGAPALI
jgi:hypothetical protein